MDIRLGTSGFSYKDWKGPFYPEGLKQSEMLRFYARHFRTVEINSSYYGVPGPETTTRRTEEVPDGFEFVLKAHQDMTHSDRFVREAWEDFPPCRWRPDTEPRSTSARAGMGASSQLF